jgi:AcrR family transcriptional regulator
VIWDRLPVPQRGPVLSRSRIVAAAIELADEKGLEALTMRNVGAALGSTGMSLYRHVGSKDDLIQLMLDEIFAEDDVSGLPTGDWRADLTTLATAERARRLRHPWSVETTPRPALGPNTLRLFEAELSVFDYLDLDMRLRGWLTNTVESFVRGIVAEELAEQAEQRRSGLSTEEWKRSMGPYIRRIIAEGTYPRVAAFFTQDAVARARERDFELGLACLLDGLERLITHERSLAD